MKDSCHCLILSKTLFSVHFDDSQKCFLVWFPHIVIKCTELRFSYNIASTDKFNAFLEVQSTIKILAGYFK